MLNRSPLAKVSLIVTALIMGLSVACAPGPAVPAEVDLTGTWKADITTPDGDLEVFMKISKSPQGAYRAVMDVPMMDAYDFPITFTYENGVVHYLIDEVGAVFDGTLTDPSTIEGTASLGGGGEGPQIFHRVEE